MALLYCLHAFVEVHLPMHRSCPTYSRGSISSWLWVALRLGGLLEGNFLLLPFVSLHLGLIIIFLPRIYLTDIYTQNLFDLHVELVEQKGW